MNVEEALEVVMASRSRERFGATDQGLADRFALLHGDRVRFVPDEGSQGTWRRWTGTHWRYATPVEIQALKNDVQRLLLLEAASVTDGDSQALKFAMRAQSMTTIRNMVALAATDETLWSRLDTFDQQPHLLNFVNGTLDLRTGALLTHDPAHMLSRCVPHHYRPDAKSPKWRSMVDRALKVCADGGETAAALQTVFGHALFGKNYEQHLIIINGAPRAGKSKMIEIFNAVLGADYCHTSRPDLVIRGKNAHHESEIYTLRQKRFVSISETDSLMQFEETRVKDLTGADKVTTRQMYASQEVAIPVTWTIFVATNDAPNVRHWDGAVARRIVIFPVGPSLEPHEVNGSIAEEIISQEAEGVLAWAVEGAIRWWNDHSAPGRSYTVDQMPAAVQQATAAYAEDNDPIARLLRDHVIEEPGFKTPFAAIRDRLMTLEGGMGVTSKALSKRLQADRRFVKDARSNWLNLRLQDLDGVEDLTVDEVMKAWARQHAIGV